MMNLRNKQVHFRLGGETSPTNAPVVNRVTVQQTVIVPPITALRIDLESAGMASDYLIEPKGNTTLLVPKTVCAKGQKPTLCFLNITDNPVRIPKGDEEGYTQEVKVIQSMDEEPLPSVGTCTTPSTLQKGSPKSGIPSHLKDLYEDSCSELSHVNKVDDQEKQFQEIREIDDHIIDELFNNFEKTDTTRENNTANISSDKAEEEYGRLFNDPEKTFDESET
ncbi:FNBP1 [Mytilus coruscus]|uniref:FNBP1 n=1 Tax=Mytilus coruscus TaxID=42192 RepID=A0A6J8ATE8_MYTCO|nr:FNBP1 [Mytilus coruscus]